MTYCDICEREIIQKDEEYNCDICGSKVCHYCCTIKIDYNQICCECIEVVKKIKQEIQDGQ